MHLFGVHSQENLVLQLVIPASNIDDYSTYQSKPSHPPDSIAAGLKAMQEDSGGCRGLIECDLSIPPFQSFFRLTFGFRETLLLLDVCG